MARKRKQKIIKPKVVDVFQDYVLPPPELHQHEKVEIYGDEKRKRARVLNNPLDYYFARTDITRDQHNAGRNFLRLYQRGGSPPNAKGMDLMSVRGIQGDGTHHAEMRELYRRAEESFTNPVHRRIVFDVVCTGEYAKSSLPKALMELHLPIQSARRGMKYLRDGLDDLVAHFSGKRSYEGFRKSIDRDGSEG